jgi:outer membrane lipoprotein SlyB
VKGRNVSIQTTAEGGVVSKTLTGATFFGSGTAIFGGLNANELAAIGGLVIGVLGLLINWYYKHKHYELAKQQSEFKPGLTE